MALRLLDRCRRVVDVRDVFGGVGRVPDLVEQGRVQDRRVEGAPGLGPVGADRAGEQRLVRMVQEVEAAVAREEEGVALRGRFGECLQGACERHVERADAEGAGCRDRREGLGHREPVQEAVDRADPQRIAGRVHQEDEAEVPGARGGLLARAAADQVAHQVVLPSAITAWWVARSACASARSAGSRERPQPVAETVLGGGAHAASSPRMVRSMTAVAPTGVLLPW
ncbi:hypothetical protein LSPH26S_04755 [Lysinibacillus sphaericus]